jgi:hypothetical protein
MSGATAVFTFGGAGGIFRRVADRMIGFEAGVEGADSGTSG